MTKEVKKIICDPPQGGSSLFSMDFASDSLSWVKGICQTLETSCNEYVDACNNYVNTAGEHIKKIYEEVCEWENPYDAKEPISGLDLKHDTIAKVSNESSVELLKNSREKPSACDQTHPNVSIPEDSYLVALSSESQAQSHGIAYGDNEERLSTGAICCSDDSEENFRETSDTFKLCANPTGSPIQDCVQLLASHYDGGLTTISGISQGTMGSWRNDHGSKIGPYKLESSEEFHENDIAEVSDGREDLTSSAANMPIQNLQTEEFETIKAEDFCDDAKKNEIALISHCADKNMSFKKKLRNVFISRKGYDLVNYQNKNNNTRLQNKQMSFAPPVPRGDLYLKKSSIQESIESEWELL